MKLKSLILSFALTLFAVSGLMAQDKYEFATLKNVNSTIYFTSAENTELIQPKPKETEKELLKKLNELNDKGWEVYNTTEVSGSIYGITYFLRKKKN